MDSRIRLYWSRIDKEIRRALLFSVSVTFGILVLAGIIRHAILGGVYQVAVVPVSTSAQIVQAIKAKRVTDGMLSIGEPGSENINPQITNIVYFSDQQWVVADLPANGKFKQSATVILRQHQGRYTIVVGPGSNFPRSALKKANVPPDAISYLEGRDRVSG